MPRRIGGQAMITDEMVKAAKAVAYARPINDILYNPADDAMRLALEAVAPMILTATAPPLPWSDAQMRLMGGEMTSQEIRTVRAFAPMIRAAALEEAAAYCAKTEMAHVVISTGPFAGYVAIDDLGGQRNSHSGHGYAAAIRAMKDSK
jgi:hypothetical protein